MIDNDDISMKMIHYNPPFYVSPPLCFSKFVAGNVVQVELDDDMVYPYEEKNGLTVKIYLLFNTAVLASDVTNVTTYVLNQGALQGMSRYRGHYGTEMVLSEWLQLQKIRCILPRELRL